MSRELKFRGWDNVGSYEYSNNDFMHFFKWAAYDSNTIIEQFTGRKDEDNVDIYEGDVVIINTISGKHREIVFNNGSYRVNCRQNIKTSFPLSDFNDNEINIVGNIHQNLELHFP